MTEWINYHSHNRHLFVPPTEGARPVTMTPQDTVEHLEDMIRLLEAALEFYADSKNWQSPSSGFALQYDPQPPEVQRDRGRRALLALAKNKGVLG